LKNKTIIILFIIFTFISSSILPSAFAEKTITPQEDDQSDIGDGLFNLVDKILVNFFKLPYQIRNKITINNFLLKKIFPWYIARLQDPVFFLAEPATIDIKYLGETDIKLSSPNFKEWPLADYEYLKFELEIPDNIPEGALVYRFYPSKIIYIDKGVIPEVKIRLITNFPTDFEIPDQFVLKVNITRYQIINNLFTNAVEMTGSYLRALGYLQFASQVQGVNTQNAVVDLVVKEDRYHLLQIIPPEKVEMSANEVKSIPFKIINLGSHTDIFNFNVITPEGSDLSISAPDAVSLKPNEERIVYLGVGTPIRFQDLGSLYNLKIQAVSMYDEDSVFENTIGIVTRGVYVSGASVFYSIGILPILFLIFAYFYIKRKKHLDSICMKPDKPWDIPIERENLEKLKKQKNKKKYNETVKRIEEEYKSSILWYNNYCKAMVNKSNDKPFDIFETLQNLTKSSLGSIANIPKSFKLKTKKPKKVKKQKILKPVQTKKKEEISSKTTEKVDKKQEPVKTSEPSSKLKREETRPIKEKSDFEKQKLNRTLAKILNEQEKQKKKLKSNQV